MLDNYAEETRPLFKLLRTEAFRFVLVHFNHYSLIHQLKEDLRQHFPDRAFFETDAKEVSYRGMVDSYYDLGKGIFLINNFEGVLTDPQKYTGLNLRRDKLAKYPIAMICFISPGAQALSARDIMEKMPDLWSFRSLMIDLKTDVSVIEQISSSKSDYYNNRSDQISSLGGYSSTGKLHELERIQKAIAATSPNESILLQTLYGQMKDIQKDLDLYTEAIQTISILKSITNDKEGLANLYSDEGDICNATGKYSEALNAFNISMSLYMEYPDNNKKNISVVNQRLGLVYMNMGNINEAFNFYLKYNSIEKELLESAPQNISFKNRLAVSYNYLGDAYIGLGRLDEALLHYEQYNRLEKELFSSYPQNADFKNNLALSYEKLGSTQSLLGNPEKALEYYEQDVQLTKELYEDNPQNVSYKNGLAISYEKLGEIQALLGNLDDALKYYEQDVQLTKELYRAYPGNADFKNGLAVSYEKLGATYASLSNYQKALEYYEKEKKLFEELSEVYPQNVSFKNGLAVSYSRLGSIYKKNASAKEQAIQYIQMAEQLWEELVTASPDYAEFKNNLTWITKELDELNDQSLNILSNETADKPNTETADEVSDTTM